MSRSSRAAILGSYSGMVVCILAVELHSWLFVVGGFYMFICLYGGVRRFSALSPYADAQPDSVAVLYKTQHEVDGARGACSLWIRLLFSYQLQQGFSISRSLLGAYGVYLFWLRS